MGTTVRILLTSIAVSAGLAAGGCSGDDSTSTGDCGVTHEQKTITTQEPAEDPGLQFKLDSCRVDIDACGQLCALAMTQAGIPFDNTATTGGGDQGIPVPNGEPLPPGSPGIVTTPVNPALACDVKFYGDGTVEMVVHYDVFEATLGCPVNQTDFTPGQGSGTAIPGGV
jgi:hypothetical protein